MCIEQNPYFGDKNVRDHKDLENLPHLILVPGTLCSQWEVEIKSIVKGHTFTVLLYGAGKAQHDQFWEADGPFQRAKLSGASIIIVASHSVSLRNVLHRVAPHSPLGPTAGFLYTLRLDQAQGRSSVGSPSGSPNSQSTCFKDALWPKIPVNYPGRGAGVSQHRSETLRCAPHSTAGSFRIYPNCDPPSDVDEGEFHFVYSCKG